MRRWYSDWCCQHIAVPAADQCTSPSAAKLIACQASWHSSGAFGQLMFDEPLDTVMLGVLGDRNYWGDSAAAVDSCVRSFLGEAWAARE
jgi:hypothetical protein